MIIDQEDLLLGIHQHTPCLLSRLALWPRACPLVHWLKLPWAISADITPWTAGKKRGFWRLRWRRAPAALMRLHTRLSGCVPSALQPDTIWSEGLQLVELVAAL